VLVAIFDPPLVQYARVREFLRTSGHRVTTSAAKRALAVVKNSGFDRMAAQRRRGADPRPATTVDEAL
jgi:hypothetical protein